MKPYNLRATVSRQVVDDITMRVEARSENEAMGKAFRVLSIFPDPHEESGIPVCYISKRATDHLEVLSIVKDEDARTEEPA